MHSGKHEKGSPKDTYDKWLCSEYIWNSELIVNLK